VLPAGSEKSALLGIALVINDFARIPVTAASQGRVVKQVELSW
jgi:hypothetical protein